MQGALTHYEGPKTHDHPRDEGHRGPRPVTNYPVHRPGGEQETQSHQEVEASEGSPRRRNGQGKEGEQGHGRDVRQVQTEG